LSDLFQKVPPPLPVTKKTVKSKTRTTLIYILAAITIIVFIAIQLRSNNQIREKEVLNSQINIIKNNIRRYVTVGNSAYQISPLGGINGLSIIVSNNTDYLLEKVLVSIRYIKANGEDWKKEKIEFTLIPPNSQMTLKAPDSNRGTSIEYNIDSISSNALGL